MQRHCRMSTRLPQAPPVFCQVCVQIGFGPKDFRVCATGGASQRNILGFDVGIDAAATTQAFNIAGDKPCLGRTLPDEPDSVSILRSSFPLVRLRSPSFLVRVRLFQTQSNICQFQEPVALRWLSWTNLPANFRRRPFEAMPWCNPQVTFGIRAFAVFGFLRHIQHTDVYRMSSSCVRFLR